MEEIILRSIPTIEELSSIDINNTEISCSQDLIYDTKSRDLIKRGYLLICSVFRGGRILWKLRFPNKTDVYITQPHDVLTHIKDMILSHGNRLENFFGYFPKKLFAIDSTRVVIDDNTHIDFVGWSLIPMGAYAVKYSRTTPGECSLPPGKYSPSENISCPPDKYECLMCILDKPSFQLYRPDITSASQQKDVWKYIHTSDQSPDVFGIYDKFLGMTEERLRFLEYMLMNDDSSSDDLDDVSSDEIEQILQNPSDKS